MNYTLDPALIPLGWPKLLNLCPEPGRPEHCVYGCPHDLWDAHFRAYCDALASGDHAAPEPISWGHEIFDNPTDYGMVPWGCEDYTQYEAAYAADAKAKLVDAGRDMTAEGCAGFVAWYVRQKMLGEPIGGLRFALCHRMGGVQGGC